MSRFLVGIGMVIVAACAPVTRGEESAKVALVDGLAILADEVDAKLGNNLAQLQEQIYKLRQQQVEAIIDQKLLEAEAARRKVTAAALVETEVNAKVAAVTPADVEKFFKENSTRLQGDFKSLEGQIKTFLAAQRMQLAQRTFLKSLRAAAKVEVFLPRPPIFRTEVAVAGAPVRGNPAAPVTIVEFSDFHCGFCRNTLPVLEQLRAKYGDKIKLVYRDYPLDSLHPEARAVSEASLCAHEQGKFWQFHDRVFASSADASPETLMRLGKEAGIDLEAWQKCNKSGKYKDSVEASVQEGRRLGINGTPTFFINGRMLVGAQPADTFLTIIEEELALAAAAAAGTPAKGGGR